MGATVTSFYFLCFLLTVIIVYYIVPKKLQWCVLLLASIAYYLLSGNGILILYPVLTCLTAWLCTRQIGKAQEQSVKRIWMIAAVCLLIGTLVVLKYVNFGINTINGMAYLFGGGQVVSGFHFLIPLGISFYTFSVLGYVIDVYNGIAVPQKSLWKLMTYGMYFPAILSGPIMKYREDAEQFFTPHPFDYKQVTFGMQRMLWGFFKTLVISERMNLIVNTVYGDYYTYQGAYIWLATVCYAFQLYTNFSGCMDIVLGISEIFGIRLPENFETPFFSKTISEYWRRWHITLGVWMKEYVFYPLLRTGSFTKLGKTLRAKFGHLTVEEGQQQGADVRAVDVGIGHNDDAVVAQLFGIEFFLTDTGTECSNQSGDFLAGEHFLKTGFFHVENLTLQGQNGLEFTVTALFGRTTGGITLDQIEFG